MYTDAPGFSLSLCPEKPIITENMQNAFNTPNLLLYFGHVPQRPVLKV
jgi:hypothetical protein